jgi:hypothetical protein
VLCQVPTSKKFFDYGEKAGQQVMADPGSALTVVLIIVFVASLAFGLLFLLGTKRQPVKSGAGKRTCGGPPPDHRGQGGRNILAPDAMESGISRAFRRIDNAINLFLSGLLFVYKWTFNYNGRPEAPDSATAISEEPCTRIDTLASSAATTVVSEEPRTRIAELPPPEPTTQSSVTVPRVIQPQPPATQPVTGLGSGHRPYGIQAIIDTIGEGIGITLTGMSDGIVFAFNGFINLFKWILRIDK